MKRLWMLLVLCLLFCGEIRAATVLEVKSGDIFINAGNETGISIGTLFNVYRNKEVEAEFGNITFTTRVFIGRIYAYKVAQNQTVARVKELPSVTEVENRAVVKGDIAQPAFVLPADELFGVGKDDILVTGISNLEHLVKFIKRFKPIKIRIEGHADNQVKNANKITRAQAHSIQSWLVNQGELDARLFVPVGYGDQKPLAPNQTPEGRRTNRRVEIVIED